MAAKKAFKRYLSLLKIYGKMDFSWVFRNMKIALVILLGDLVSSISAISGVFMLSFKFGSIGAMDKYEILFMLGYNTILTGVFLTFFVNNNAHISRIIGRGQFDHMLIQPLSIPCQLMTSGFAPITGASNLLTGGIITFIAIKNIGLPISILWFLKFFGFLILSIIIMISYSYIFSSSAFYAPVAAEEISTYVIDELEQVSLFPLSAMPNFAKAVLTTVLPTGLLAWYPSQLLIGKTPLPLGSSHQILMAALLAFTAQYLFRKGLGHYVKTGSSRYIAAGHRS